MAGVDVWNGSAYVGVKDIQVSTGTAFKQAKKMKAWSGSTWVLTWVPRVPTVVISFSKTGVQVGEKFDVTVTYSAGWPEGTTVRVTTTTGHDQTLTTVEGQTTVKILQISHAGAGSPVWSAVATNLGGVSATATKTQTVTAAAPTHFHELLPSGGNIQAAMDRAYDWFVANKAVPVDFNDENDFACVELAASGVYTLTTPLKTRRGVRVIGAGSGATRPTVRAVNPSSHLGYTSDNGGGGYNSPHTDWKFQNIQFDCTTYAGGFSIVHTKRYCFQDCSFKNMGGKKHYIEVNSSGGPRQDGVYNVQILGCEFTNSSKTTTNGEPRRTEDECVQMDYSWHGAAANTADDGTVSNNVLIQDCNFHDAPRAIGGHRYQTEAGNGSPKGMHSNITITGNRIEDISPYTYGDSDPNGRGSEGAIRGYVWKHVTVADNELFRCYQPINFFVPGDAIGSTNPGGYTITGNLIRDKTSDRPGINSSVQSGAPLLHDQIICEGNTVDGQWGGSDYFIGFEDTGTAKNSGSNYGVIIRDNVFKPGNMTASEEAAYNKYRADSADNGGSAVMVSITGNTISDGTVDNS